MSLRKSRGFSLVELLVVGVISVALVGGLAVAVANFANRAVENTAVILVREEITKAVSFIANELKESRYTYRQGAVDTCASAGGSNTTYNLLFCPARMGATGTINDDGGLSGSFSRTNLAGGSNTFIQLAFWVRATASGLSGCSSSKQDGVLLAVPSTLASTLAANKYNLTNTDTNGNISGCDLVPYGTSGSTPAYSLIVYFVRAANDAGFSSPYTWDGPSVLYRWQSPIVGIPYDSFGFTAGKPSNVPSGSYILSPPTPQSSGSGEVIADFLDNIPASGLGPLNVASSANNAQSMDVSIEGGLYTSTSATNYPGTDVTKANNYLGNADATKLGIEETRLFYRTTVIARNACGGLNTCPTDPNN